MTDKNKEKPEPTKSEAEPVKAKPVGPDNVQFKTNFELLRETRQVEVVVEKSSSSKKDSKKES